MTGIEPASSAWEADVLPMNYICMSLSILQSFKNFNLTNEKICDKIIFKSTNLEKDEEERS